MARPQRSSQGVKPVRRKNSGRKNLGKSAVGPVASARLSAVIRPLPIVGLGASAGGLEALEKFLTQVTTNCGIAFVVVSHLHSGHVSLLPALLGKCSWMRVNTAANGMAVEPNTVSTSLPKSCLGIIHGTLQVREPDDTGLLRLPIDYFFRSLAEDQKERAIGIAFSGSGTDVTLGLKAIKGATGRTMAQANDDLQHLLNSTAIATVFLDQKLQIKRYTMEAYKLAKLIASDVGRPIGDLTSSLVYDQLPADAEEVLQKLGLNEREVQTRDGEWRQVRISTYPTTENVIDGLVVTFVDITRVKRAEQAAQHSHIYAESIMATIREPSLVLDENFCVVSANRAFHQTFKPSAREVPRQRICKTSGGQWNIPTLRKRLGEFIPRDTSFEDFKVEHIVAGLGRQVMLLSARRLAVETGAPDRIQLAFAAARGPCGAGKKLDAKGKGFAV